MKKQADGILDYWRHQHFVRAQGYTEQEASNAVRALRSREDDETVSLTRKSKTYADAVKASEGAIEVGAATGRGTKKTYAQVVRGNN